MRILHLPDCVKKYPHIFTIGCGKNVNCLENDYVRHLQRMLITFSRVKNETEQTPAQYFPRK